MGKFFPILFNAWVVALFSNAIMGEPCEINSDGKVCGSVGLFGKILDSERG